MLDINTVSYIVSGKSNAARLRLELLSPSHRPCVSAISEREILYGLAKNPRARPIRVLVEEFLAKMTVLPWTSQETAVYGER